MSDGMNFGGGYSRFRHVDVQRREPRFYQDGLSIVHKVTGARFYMLPGGRWVDVETWREKMGKYQP